MKGFAFVTSWAYNTVELLLIFNKNSGNDDSLKSNDMRKDFWKGYSKLLLRVLHVLNELHAVYLGSNAMFCLISFENSCAPLPSFLRWWNWFVIKVRVTFQFVVINSMKDFTRNRIPFVDRKAINPFSTSIKRPNKTLIWFGHRASSFSNHAFRNS